MKFYDENKNLIINLEPNDNVIIINNEKTNIIDEDEEKNYNIKINKDNEKIDSSLTTKNNKFLFLNSDDEENNE